MKPDATALAVSLLSSVVLMFSDTAAGRFWLSAGVARIHSSFAMREVVRRAIPETALRR
jgi:hypothetical protein